MRWARSTTPNRSQKEKKRVWSSRQWPRLRRREHESRINTDHDISKAATVAITLLTANHRLRVCVCVWLCVVSSRPCKTGEPNKNNAECMQYIRCEHKIHLNIYMKSIWDHIFFFHSHQMYIAMMSYYCWFVFRTPRAKSERHGFNRCAMPIYWQININMQCIRSRMLLIKCTFSLSSPAARIVRYLTIVIWLCNSVISYAAQWILFTFHRTLWCILFVWIESPVWVILF